MHTPNSPAASITFDALHAFADVYEKLCGRRLSPGSLTHDPDTLRDALETAAGAEDAELYAAAERLVLTLHTARGYSIGANLS